MRRLLSLGWLRRGIIGGSLGALLLLSGCSALKLGYRQGPSLGGWWLDNQLDFDTRQSARVREALNAWFHWHQRTQVAGYAQQLARLRADSERSVTGVQVCRWNETARELWTQALEPLLPAAAEVAASLLPAQIDHLERKQTRHTADLREEMLLPDAGARRQAMLERTVKRAESFYGRLSTAQRQLIDEALSNSPFKLEEWFVERDVRQHELLAELRQIAANKPPLTQIEDRLRRLARRFDGRDPVGPREQAAALTAYNCELTARLHQTATAEQRRHLAQKLAGWESDFRTLAAERLGDAAVAAGGPSIR
jgi:hypothetical protein